MALYEKPFTQIVEDVMAEMNERSTESLVEAKYKRRVNDIYMRDIPSRFEWDWLHKTSYLTLSARYNTGTVTVVNGSANVTGASTVWTSSHTGWKFSIPSTNEIYTFTRTAATTGTISPVYIGDSDDTLSYVLFQDTYALATDFGIPTTEPGFYYDISQGRQKLEWYDDGKWYQRFTTQASTYPTAWRECPNRSSIGLFQVEISPPVTTNMLLNYEYIKALPEMIEFTTGTASTTIGSTTVTTLADYSSYISVGQYFRIDSDGTWRKIIAISTTTLTLDSAYPSTNNAVAYTISDVPSMPYQFQEGLFYGACWLTALEQSDRVMGGYFQAYIRALDFDMARRNRKRYGRQYWKHGWSINPGSK